MAEKNLVEEALLQMENLQEAITNNAKGILASTMKEEISQLVKESLSDEDEIEISDTEMSEQEELDLDVDVEDEDEDEENVELDMDSFSDNEEDEEDNDDFEMGDDEMMMTDLPDDEESISPLDLTNASDEEILKVFKAMGEEDGIIVKQDNDEIHLKDEKSNVEYEIHLGESEEDVAEGDYNEEEVMYEIEMDDEESEEEVMYEIEMDDEESEEEVMYEIEMDDEESEEDVEYEETKESSIRSFVNGRKLNKKPNKFPKIFKRPGVKSESLEKEVNLLREKNEEYRKALNIFKEKLNEVAVFNSNLAYATRLFTEHSTTKQEKINILRRFDGVESLKESKSLYKTIKEDLGGKENTVMTESVQSKVQKTPTKGSANNLIESKTYENPQFLRMKDLMNKLK